MPINKGEINISPIISAVKLDCDGILLTAMQNSLANGENPASALLCTAQSHSYYEVIIVKNGNLTIEISETAEDLGAGQFMLIPPRVPYRIIKHDDECRLFSICFLPEKDEEILRQTQNGYSADGFTGEDAQFVFNIISELERTHGESPSSGAIYRKRSLMGVLLSYILEKTARFDRHIPDESDSRLTLYRKIENYLDSNFDKPISMATLGEYLNYSRTQLRRLMEDCYGMPFSEKLREIRLAAAKRLLREGELTIDEIAAACGYETRQGFETMFQKYVGVTPNRYRTE